MPIEKNIIIPARPHALKTGDLLCRLLLLALVSLTLTPGATDASSNPYATPLAHSESPFESQRQLYLQAIEAYDKGHYRQFERISTGLHDYPLYPYLVYKSYRRQLNQLDNSQIGRFLQDYDGTVVSEWLRKKLIQHYAKQKQWHDLIDIYRPNSGVSAECRYLGALIHTGQTHLALPRIKNLWLSPISRPKECDPVFKLWEDAGQKSTALVWKRFKLAIHDGNRKLARYLVRSLSPSDATIAQKWLKLHHKPDSYEPDSIKALKHAEQSSIMLNWLSRLASRDIDKAISYYHSLQNYPFSNDQRAQLVRRIGLSLARKHLPDAGIWLDRVPREYYDRQVREWRIRTAIRQGDWSHVISSIDRLSPAEQSQHRWQFWWAYANEEVGNTPDALGIYQYLATQRSYYGFLAADRIGSNYNFEDRPINPSQQQLQFIRQQPETIRAREFYLMDQQLPARREWQRLLSRLDAEQKLAASKLAQLWGWHDRAIISMGQTRYRDDIELRFPLHHANKVHNWSSQHNIDPAWTYAIIRRESAFIPDARSSVGAMGLMQLMPATARSMARHMKIRYAGQKTLLKSNTNIRLGTGYLERMLERLNLQVLATAAYNAGPHRVEDWLPESRTMEALRWIETIPFTETREYVSNVLAYMAIYEHRLERDITPLSQRMPPVPARNAPTMTASDEQPVQPTAQAENPQRNNAG